MKRGKTNKLLNAEKDDGLNLRSILDRYFVRWHWFVVALILSLLIAFIYLKTTTPVYQSVTSIIIDDEDKNRTSREQELFDDLGLVNGMGAGKIENELGLLRSKRLLQNSVNTLGLNVGYFDEGLFSSEELYLSSPYLVELTNSDERKIGEMARDKANEFKIKSIAEDRFKITHIDKDTFYTVASGEVLELDFGILSPRRNPEYEPLDADEDSPEITLRIVPAKSVAFKYRSKIKVQLIDENATLIELSLEDRIPRRAHDILNQVVLEYNREAIEDKNLVAENTAFFINERLKIIDSELDSVESGKESFKASNRLTNIDVESSLIMQNASEYSVKRQELNSQLALLESMLQYLESAQDEMLPSNMGINDSGLSELIEEYNSLIIERNKLSPTPNHPNALRLSQQIRTLRGNLMQSFKRVQANLRISRNNLARQAGIISSQISEVPAQERQFRDIERQQNIKEALYLLLLEKREENSLALAAAAPKAKVVDPAYTLEIPVSPNSGIIYFGALLAGLAIPVLIINGKELLSDKIRSVEDIHKRIKNAPIIGEIPELKDKLNIRMNERTPISESFRIIVANLQYSQAYRNRMPENGFCIFVTSSVKGEGKTFTSVNLAMTLALSGYQVLLVGADLRNPQLHQYARTGKNPVGLGDYLADEAEVRTLDKYLVRTDLHKNIKLLLSGNIPQNPTELLKRDRTGPVFDRLKKSFDFVIVDTAPAMLIADTLMISRSADLTLYVARAGHTRKALLNFIVDAANDGKIVEPVLVLNGVDLKNTAYGNDYEYGSVTEEADYMAKGRVALSYALSLAQNQYQKLMDKVRK